MKNKKIAIFINRYSEDNFLSGGDKVNFFIIKVLAELGFIIDIFCQETAVTNSIYINNFYIKYTDNDFIKEKYLFTLGENFYYNKTFLYIHENTRHFRNKYTRTAFTNFIQYVFAHRRKKEIDNRLLNEKNIIENAQYLLLPSSIVKNDILEFFNVKEENIFILPPCIDVAISVIRKENDIFTFGLSARGFNNKGGWQVILSSLFLKLLGKKFKVLIIKPFADTITPLKIIINLLCLKNNIILLDYCHNMKDEFYSKIDCLVMPSTREAFGLVAAEAMSFGIPTIVSSRCGIKDFIKNNDNSLVYEYNKPIRNLFKCMLNMLNKSDLQNMKYNAKNISKELSYDKLKENIKHILYKTNFL